MQIFSRQAAMMDALITHFAEQIRRKKEHAESHPTENVHEGWYISTMIYHCLFMLSPSISCGTPFLLGRTFICFHT